MKILVSVGTTAYDSLIEKVDLVSSSFSDFEFFAQISTDCSYKPINIKYIDFIENFSDFVLGYDVIITHAGAGNIYSLLELEKRLVVVPNLTRIDKHQADIARFVQENNFCEVCWELDALIHSLETVIHHSYAKYSKQDFFGSKFILEFFGI